MRSNLISFITSQILIYKKRVYNEGINERISVLIFARYYTISNSEEKCQVRAIRIILYNITNTSK